MHESHIGGQKQGTQRKRGRCWCMLNLIESEKEKREREKERPFLGNMAKGKDEKRQGTKKAERGRGGESGADTKRRPAAVNGPYRTVAIIYQCPPTCPLQRPGLIPIRSLRPPPPAPASVPRLHQTRGRQKRPSERCCGARALSLVLSLVLAA